MEYGFSSENFADLTLQEWMEVFLAVTVVAVSTGFLIAEIMGVEAAVPLSVIFYGVMPGAMLVIGFLTYEVAKTVYQTENVGGYGNLPAGMMAMLLGIVAINIGFITAISGTTVLTGSMGTMQVSFLIVVLSMALSLSVISREMMEVS